MFFYNEFEVDNNYVVLWNVNKRKLVWEYDFFQYLQEITDDENTFIQSAIFSSDGRYITFSAFNRDPLNDEREFFIDEQLKYEIIAQLPHLKNVILKMQNSGTKIGLN